ncbi:hypothetical protein FACS189415_1540 [Bacteroidia bacterium]|nr:hypothetical protein FACS189415_1540 [Bacteroidia bacterium]
MLTIPQLEQLKILPGRAIRRLVAEKKIPTVKVGTRVYINRAVFERYLSGESFCLVEARGDKLNEL